MSRATIERRLRLAEEAVLTRGFPKTEVTQVITLDVSSSEYEQRAYLDREELRRLEVLRERYPAVPDLEDRVVFVAVADYSNVAVGG